LDSLTWLGLWTASLGSWFLLWFWLRRFNLAEHERIEIGMPGMALALFAGPVYLAAAIAAILRRPLAYAVTAKGSLRSADSLATFRLHLCWAAVAAGLLGASFALGHDYLALRAWSGLAVLSGLGPPVIALMSEIAHRWSAARSPDPTLASTARGVAPPTWALRYDSGRASYDKETGNWHVRFVVDQSGASIRASAVVPHPRHPLPRPSRPERSERPSREQR
jgi:hypothetical protein